MKVVVTIVLRRLCLFSAMEKLKRIVGNHIYYNQSTVVAVLLCNTLGNFYVPEMGEVIEWWLVSDWLAERLVAEGEIVLSEYGCSWWGRTTSGQALYMDAVIKRICDNL